MKKAKTKLKLIYETGVSMQCDTTHTYEELKRIMRSAKKDGEAEIETATEDREVENDCMIIYSEKLLFYMIAAIKDTSLISPRRDIIQLQ